MQEAKDGFQLTASKEMEVLVSQPQGLSELGSRFFPEPPVNNPAVWHLDFGLVKPGSEKSVGPT